MLPGGEYRAGGNGSNGTSTSTGDTGDDDSTTGTGTTWWTTTGATDSSPSGGPGTTAGESASNDDSTGSSTDNDDPSKPTVGGSNDDTAGSTGTSSTGGPEDVPFTIDVITKQFIGPLSWGGIGGSPGPFIDVFAHAAFYALAGSTDVAYNENPVSGHLASGEYRIFSDLFLTGTCTGDGYIELDGLDFVPDTPDGDGWIPDINTVGGQEAGPLYGVVNPVDWTVASEDDGDGYTKITISYVVSGHPNPALEPSFLAVAFRSRPDIWHKLVVELECDGGVLQITRTSSRSSFPSVRTWVYQDGDRQINQVRAGVQGPFSALWSLEAIPAP
jgi:hypothetical protein